MYHPRFSLMSFVTEFLLLFTTSGHHCGSSFIRVKLSVAGCASEVEFFVVAMTAKLLIISLSDERKRTSNAKPLYHKIRKAASLLLHHVVNYFYQFFEKVLVPFYFQALFTN